MGVYNLSGKEVTVMAEKTCCGHRTKERSEKDYKDLANRLSRIEGQVRGIRKMLDENAYCPDIMVQVAAVKSALDGFNCMLLEEHIRSCVAEDIRSGDDGTITELIGTIRKITK